jgi:hypothetical protein
MNLSSINDSNFYQTLVSWFKNRVLDDREDVKILISMPNEDEKNLFISLVTEFNNIERKKIRPYNNSIQHLFDESLKKITPFVNNCFIYYNQLNESNNKFKNYTYTTLSEEEKSKVERCGQVFGDCFKENLRKLNFEELFSEKDSSSVLRKQPQQRQQPQSSSIPSSNNKKKKRKQKKRKRNEVVPATTDNDCTDDDNEGEMANSASSNPALYNPDTHPPAPASASSASNDVPPPPASASAPNDVPPPPAAAADDDVGETTKHSRTAAPNPSVSNDVPSPPPPPPPAFITPDLLASSNADPSPSPPVFTPDLLASSNDPPQLSNNKKSYNQQQQRNIESSFHPPNSRRISIINDSNPIDLYNELISSFRKDSFKNNSGSTYNTVESLFKNFKYIHSEYIDSTFCNDEDFKSVYRTILYSNLQLNMLDFLSLGPQQMVESIVIDFYFSMLNFRELSLFENGVKKKKSFFYNSSLYTFLISTGNENEFSKSKSLLGNYLLDYSLLFIPVHISQHWLLCQIELNENNITVSTFDSKTIHNVDQKNVQKLIGKWIKDELKQFPQYNNNIEPNCESALSFQQDKSNNWDCGVIMIFNAFFLTDGIFDLTKINLKNKSIMKDEIIPNARYKIAMDIERGYIPDYRIKSFFEIMELFPFKKDKILKKKPNKQLAELCSFVEGSEEKKHFNLLLVENNNEDFGELLKQEREQSDKWRFQYYEIQIKMISVLFPFNVVLEKFYEIESKNLQTVLLNQLSNMEKKKDKDLEEVVQDCKLINNNRRKRFHYHINNEESIQKLPSIFQLFFTKLKKAIIAVTKNCINNVKSPDIAILYSKAGCERQKTHTDYDTATDNDKELAKNSFFAIFAIMDNTSVVVDAENNGIIKIIAIPKGSLFIARGDLIHAGSDYENENVRLHVYFDNVDLKKDKNGRSTFFDFQEE